MWHVEEQKQNSISGLKKVNHDWYSSKEERKLSILMYYQPHDDHGLLFD